MNSSKVEVRALDEVGEWLETKLGDLADFEMGQAPPGSECNKEGRGTVFVKAGEFGEFYPVEVEWTTKPLKHGRKGDVFICVVGATAGKLNLGIDCAIGRSVAAIRPHDGVDTKFVYYQLMPWVLKLRAGSTGSAQGVISKKQLKEIPFKITSLVQQKRIVAEIEKQFSRLDEAVANLKRVKANLKRYKAAVLKAAVEGKLTEEWRKAHPDVEPASKLLDRILAKRRAKWEEVELAKMEAKGKTPKNNKWKAKYKEPIAPSVVDLPELPTGWMWTTLGSLLWGIEAGKSFKCEERPPCEEEVGVIKVSAVTWGEFDETESKTCRDNTMVKENLFVRRGDFLFSRANTIELVGACVIAKDVVRNVMLSDKILRFGLVGGFNEWALYYLRSMYGRAEIERLATGNQDSMRNIGQERIRAIRIPLSPIKERDRIITEVERNLSLIRETESQVNASLKRAERLRQSILNRAFSVALEYGAGLAQPMNGG